MFEPETSYNSGRIVKLKKKVNNPKKVLENAKTNVDVKKYGVSDQEVKGFAWSRHHFTNQSGKSPKKKVPMKYNESNDGG